MRGIVVHCGRYGCIVRLQDGRLANVPADDSAAGTLRRAFNEERHRAYEFAVSDESRRPRVGLAGSHAPADPEGLERSSSPSLDEKIIEYLRQTEEWDPNGALAERVRDAKQARAERRRGT